MNDDELTVVVGMEEIDRGQPSRRTMNRCISVTSSTGGTVLCPSWTEAHQLNPLSASLFLFHSLTGPGRRAASSTMVAMAFTVDGGLDEVERECVCVCVCERAPHWNEVVGQGEEGGCWGYDVQCSLQPLFDQPRG